jgi:hypothetical protein
MPLKLIGELGALYHQYKTKDSAAVAGLFLQHLIQSLPMQLRPDSYTNFLSSTKYLVILMAGTGDVGVAILRMHYILSQKKAQYSKLIILTLVAQQEKTAHAYLAVKQSTTHFLDQVHTGSMILMKD